MELHCSFYGYLYIELVISVIRIMDTIDLDRFMDIHNSNYRYH